MRLNNHPIVRNLICLTALLVCASAPLAAQQGIDLLDAEQVLSGGASDGTVTLRAVAAEAPTGVAQADHDRDTIRYDDGMFENFEEDASPSLQPTATGGRLTGGRVEWAQRFVVAADSAVVSVRACFLRPEGDPNRSLDFSLRFYDNDPVSSVDYPGRQSGFRYIVEENIRRPGDDSCVLLRGDLVGKALDRGKHWIGIEWDTTTRKRLAGDHYTADDMAESDRRTNMALHETEVRWRSLPLSDGAEIDGWQDPRGGDRIRLTSGLKAIGVSLIVERTHAADPEPDPDPDPEPVPEASCRGGTCLLQDGRFRVRVRYTPPDPDVAANQLAAGVVSGSSAGLFSFGGDSPELLIRVVDECDQTGHWAFHAGAATAASYLVAVRDTGTDELKFYRAFGGDSVRDLLAFACGN